MLRFTKEYSLQKYKNLASLTNLKGNTDGRFKNKIHGFRA